MSDFIKKAYEANRVKDVEEAFKEFPPEEEWHHGDIEYLINETSFHYNAKCEIGDIVFVREYNYPDGTKGYNHMFVVIDSDYQAVPIEYFGMLISSKINKKEYPANILLTKDKFNKLNKDSIVKTDVIYKLSKDQIVFKIGEVDKNKVLEYKKSFSKIINNEKRD